MSEPAPDPAPPQPKIPTGAQRLTSPGPATVVMGESNPGSRITNRDSRHMLVAMLVVASVAILLYAMLILGAVKFANKATHEATNQNGMLVALVYFKNAAGFFAGGLLALSGLGVSFFTNTTATNLAGGEGDHKMQLATSSPGIVAIVMGTVIVYHSISQTQRLSLPAVGSAELTEAGDNASALPATPASTGAMHGSDHPKPDRGGAGTGQGPTGGALVEERDRGAVAYAMKAAKQPEGDPSEVEALKTRVRLLESKIKALSEQRQPEANATVRH